MAALAVQAGGSRESPWRARRPRPPPSRAVCARHRYLTRRCADGAAGLADVGPAPTFCSFLGLDDRLFCSRPCGQRVSYSSGQFLSPHAGCEARVPYAHARERHLAQPTARLSSERAHKSTCCSTGKENRTRTFDRRAGVGRACRRLGRREPSLKAEPGGPAASPPAACLPRWAPARARPPCGRRPTSRGSPRPGRKRASA